MAPTSKGLTKMPAGRPFSRPSSFTLRFANGSRSCQFRIIARRYHRPSSYPPRGLKAWQAGYQCSNDCRSFGQGQPDPPQPQARSPNHGLSGWTSQTQRQLSQRAQNSTYSASHSSCKASAGSQCIQLLPAPLAPASPRSTSQGMRQKRPLLAVIVIWLRRLN